MLKLKDMNGYADFGDFKVYDRDVWKFMVKHSTPIDRLDSRKVVEMTHWSFTILQATDDWGKKWRKGNWKFYGKDGFFNTEE